VTAGLAVGACLTWNISNVGAVADPLAGAYGVSLAAVGLLTTSLFVTHLVVQIPAGRAADRHGAQAVALAAVGAAALGNTLLLLGAAYPLAVGGRAVVGLGSGAGFVAGLDLVRAGGGRAVLQGLYGGATMAGGGLALMVVPALTDAVGWRAAYGSALILALLAALPTLAAGKLPRVGHSRENVLRDPVVLPLGLVQAATFGVAVIAGEWVVPLLERQGASAAAAGVAGSLILFAGILTRPSGGMIAGTRHSRRALAVALAGVATGCAVLAVGGPLALSTLGAFILGTAAGIPFALLFAAAQQLRPDAPGAAVALVNACGILTILIGTPLAGLTFSLPGQGRLAFVVLAVVSAAAVLVLRRIPLGSDNPGLPLTKESQTWR
jgi:MFS family permease